jgi:hypothetical protein
LQKDKYFQDFVKRQGPELQRVDNLDGINMLDMRDEMRFPSMPHGKGQYSQDLLNKLLKVNGNSYFADRNEFPNLINISMLVVF